MSSDSSERRGFIRRILKWGAIGGVAAVVLTRLRGHSADAVNMLLPGQVTEVKANTGYYEDTGMAIEHSPVVEAYNTSTSGTVAALYARTDSPQGRSVWGYASATSGFALGVLGYTESATGIGVDGFAAATTGTAPYSTGRGVSGASMGQKGVGVEGYGQATGAIGVRGSASLPGAIPIVALAAPGQTANLQEWQNSSGTPLGVVDANGQLGVGTGTPQFKINVAGIVDPTALSFDSYGIVASNIIGRRARGTVASPSACLTDDALLVLNGRGYGASGFSSASCAAIRMLAAENWTDAAQGAYMRFETTQAGGTTKTEKMRITDSGNVGIGTTTPIAQLHVKYPSANTNKGIPAVIIDNPAGGEQTVLIFSVDNSEMGRIRADKLGDVCVSTMANGAFLIRNQDLDTSNLVEVTPDGATSDGQTALLIRRNIGGTFTLQRVSMGPADSGGTGYRALRVPN